MPKRIEKPEMGEPIKYEQAKEREPDVRKFDKAEKTENLGREESLKRVYGKGEKGNIVSGVGEKRKNDDDKTVGRFVKEFYSIGIKAIDRAKKVLDPHGIDSLHDTISDKNKRNKDSSH
jgi:hypothetical protein